MWSCQNHEGEVSGLVNTYGLYVNTLSYLDSFLIGDMKVMEVRHALLYCEILVKLWSLSLVLKVAFHFSKVQKNVY